MTRSEEIAANIEKWAARLKDVEICAVTKTMPASDINAAVAAGIIHVGENRVQEITAKLPDITGSPHIHMIGRLQTNKVRQIVGKVDMIQSLDREELAAEISRRSVAAGVTTNALVQVSIAGEEQKGGVDPDRLYDFVRACGAMDGLAIKGLMAVMPIAEDPGTLRPYFRRMRRFFDELAAEDIPGAEMKVLSMGMSGDCMVAAEEGATMVRIGRGIFGSRNY
jgi:pyridoxal phosphate enzyme (YggS family)